MPIDKPSLARLVQNTQPRNIIQVVIPQSVSKKEKTDILNEFQKQVNKITTNEVVLIAVKI